MASAVEAPVTMADHRRAARCTVAAEVAALQRLHDNLDDQFDAAAQALVDVRGKLITLGVGKSGLAAHGFQYVNIDDGWEIRVQTQGRAAAVGGTTRPAVLNADALRAADGTINVNEKFPDMKALGAYIHAKGLKFGIYSSPGPRTCGQYTASWEHEEQDVATWASAVRLRKGRLRPRLRNTTTKSRR